MPVAASCMVEATLVAAAEPASARPWREASALLAGTDLPVACAGVEVLPKAAADGGVLRDAVGAATSNAAEGRARVVAAARAVVAGAVAAEDMEPGTLAKSVKTIVVVVAVWSAASMPAAASCAAEATSVAAAELASARPLRDAPTLLAGANLPVARGPRSGCSPEAAADANVLKEAAGVAVHDAAEAGARTAAGALVAVAVAMAGQDAKTGTVTAPVGMAVEAVMAAASAASVPAATSCAVEATTVVAAEPASARSRQVARALSAGATLPVTRVARGEVLPDAAGGDSMLREAAGVAVRDAAVAGARIAAAAIVAVAVAMAGGDAETVTAPVGTAVEAVMAAASAA